MFFCSREKYCVSGLHASPGTKATAATHICRSSSQAPFTPNSISHQRPVPYYEVKGEFQGPSARGSWHAIWLTGVNSWPPEIDIMEFKGNTNNWQKTFRTSSDVSTVITDVSSPGNNV